MGWSIGTLWNDLYVPDELRDELIKLAENNGHYISFYKEMLYFDSDAMEHQDFLWEDWFKDFVKEHHNISGTVIWSSVEGDNNGQIWGYQVLVGSISTINMSNSLLFLAEKHKETL